MKKTLGITSLILAFMLVSPLMSNAKIPNSELIFKKNMPAQENKFALRVAKFLENAKTIKSDFIQINPDNSTFKGKFYLHRPYRLRFEYEPKVHYLLVANGYVLISINTQDNTRVVARVRHLPDSLSSLNILLENKVDLSMFKILNIARVPNDLKKEIIKISFANKKAEDLGSMELYFEITKNTNKLNLLEWNTIDTQNLTTKTILVNPTYNQKINDKIFKKYPPVHHNRSKY